MKQLKRKMFYISIFTITPATLTTIVTTVNIIGRIYFNVFIPALNSDISFSNSTSLRESCSRIFNVFDSSVTATTSSLISFFISLLSWIRLSNFSSWYSSFCSKVTILVSFSHISLAWSVKALALSCNKKK